MFCKTYSTLKINVVSHQVPVLRQSNEIRKHEETPVVQVKTYLPYYFKVFITYGYYLCIIPYKVKTIERKHVLQENRFQKSMCIFLHPLILIVSVLSLRKNMTEKIQIRPEVLFLISLDFFFFMYVSVFLYTFWFKRRRIQDVLNLPQPPVTHKVKCRTILYIIPLLQAVYYYFVREVLDPNFSAKNCFLQHYRSTRYIWFLPPEANFNSSTPDVDLETSCFMSILTLTTWSLSFLQIICIAYFELVPLISSLAAYEYISDLKPIFCSVKIQKIKVMIKYYIQLKEFLGILNGVNGYFLLWTFVQTIPWLSSTMVDVFDTEDWKLRLFMIHYYFYYGISAYLAAECHRNGRKFMERIMQLQCEHCHEPCYHHHIMTYLTETSYHIGLKGGNFFVVSYGFLGLAVSVLMTYSMIMVQLRGVVANGNL